MRAIGIVLVVAVVLGLAPASTAQAVDVKPETATLRVTLSRDALAAGDLVALRK